MLYQIVEKVRQNIDLINFNPSEIKIQIFEKNLLESAGVVVDWFVSGFCAIVRMAIPVAKALLVTLQSQDRGATSGYLEC